MNTLNTVEDLLHLSPIEFQEMIMILYRSQGCKVFPVKIPGRYHLYVAITAKENDKRLTECRIGLQVVDRAAVRSFFPLLKQEKATQGAIITIGEVSDQARREARKKRIYLYDGNDFLALWKKLNITYPIPADERLKAEEDSQRPPSTVSEEVRTEANEMDQAVFVAPGQTDNNTKPSKFLSDEKQAPFLEKPGPESETRSEPASIQTGNDFWTGNEGSESSSSKTEGEKPTEAPILDQPPFIVTEHAEKSKADELPTDGKQPPFIDQSETWFQLNLEPGKTQTGPDSLAESEPFVGSLPEIKEEVPAGTTVFDQSAVNVPEHIEKPEAGKLPSDEKHLLFIDQPAPEVKAGPEPANIRTGIDSVAKSEAFVSSPPVVEEEIPAKPAVFDQPAVKVPEHIEKPEAGELPSGEKQAPFINQTGTGLELANTQASIDASAGREGHESLPSPTEEMVPAEAAIFDQSAASVPEQMEKPEAGELPSDENQATFVDQPTPVVKAGPEPANIQTSIDSVAKSKPPVSSPPVVKEEGPAETIVVDQSTLNMPEHIEKSEAGELPSDKKEAPYVDQPVAGIEPASIQADVDASVIREGFESLPWLTEEAAHTEVHDFDQSVLSEPEPIAGIDSERNELSKEGEQIASIDQPGPAQQTGMDLGSPLNSINYEEGAQQNLAGVPGCTSQTTTDEDKQPRPSEMEAKDEEKGLPEAVVETHLLEQDKSSETPADQSQQPQDTVSPAKLQEPRIVAFNPSQQTRNYTIGPDPDNSLLCMAYEKMEGDAPCIFITGQAGTGKSILLNYFAQKTGKRIVCLARTEIGALNIEGQTIHSFFNFPSGMINENDVPEVLDPVQRVLYCQVDTIIVDEIPMVNANLVDAMDSFMRRNGRDPNKPFGGTQVILFGDLFQSKPAVSEQEISNLLLSKYRSQYFWDAHVFQNLSIEVIELQKNYYHRDETFTALLYSIRMNSLDNAQIKLLNDRYNPDFIAPSDKFYITLTNNERITSQINQDHLKQLPLPECSLVADIEGDFDEQSYPVARQLIIRRGTQVIFVTNDRAKRWVRGTIGKVTNVSECLVQVEIDHDGSPFIFRVERENWQKFKYEFNSSTGKIEKELIGEFTQYPLCLAWAITVQKCQGQTYDNVVINLAGDNVEHGQVYAALCSCRNLDEIVLKDEIWSNDFLKLDSRVLEFARLFNQDYLKP